jgi:UDP-3-O-[3-hydroxymyristoyl] glucosamine N-acyltransferase
MGAKHWTLKQLGSYLNAQIKGDPEVAVHSLATLKNAEKGQLSFLANAKYIDQLKSTRASAVLLTEDALGACPTNAIVLDNPYLALAKIGEFFDKKPDYDAGIDPTAAIDQKAQCHSTASIGANVVIGAHTIIEKNVIVGSNTVISDHCYLAEGVHIKPNVTFYHDVKVGQETMIHSGAVIGSDGFGNAQNDNGNWFKVPQLGGVTIGEQVEIGANTTIDRGAIEDTIIHDGVKIDNQVQIAHNAIIGKNTAMAAQVGIAGSAKVGANCLLGGQCGVTGHVELTDNVMLAADTSAGSDIDKPGIYAGNLNARPHMNWKRILARINTLDKLANRVMKLEKQQK